MSNNENNNKHEKNKNKSCQQQNNNFKIVKNCNLECTQNKENGNNIQHEDFVAKSAQLEKENAALNSEIELLKKKLLNTELEVSSLKVKINQVNESFIEKSKELSVKASKQLKDAEEKNAMLLAQEKKNIKMYGNQSFYEKLLPIFISFDTAINLGMNGNNEAVQRFCLGFEMLKKQMENAFFDNGITELVIKAGEEFDAHKATATMFEPEAKKNQVVEVLTKGYMLHDRVIIPAHVKIGTKGEDNE
ncbi:nucleotide exchange factor GrpE [Mycoplasma phocimorsus]|uniref:nucleotide exchange factor GrpE n=1 Tax=Mycoplasma phocimorsus TaxID=3045839 RepID=UPI0024BF2830|nr:nucleotide exchange factor GrpE [Mycoplasma phocimorsus]MDJ1648511.1 nucleotide exchange factor GrpE [Mycoplasma phocimorsus]MDJ1649022.1 nucleotide exchange factor GrpE [Mycoplasma phocimorsus]